MNHVTPAATYAHQISRKSNYPIGLELVDSNFDYFAGGALMEPCDKNKDKTSFADVMKDVEKLLGLKMPGSEGSEKNGGVVLTEYELSRIKTAYEKTIKDDTSRSQMEYDLYGTYEPLTITITHVLNAKSGLGWTSNSHTCLPVPVFALGAGQDQFKGFYDNTEIYRKLAFLTKVSR